MLSKFLPETTYFAERVAFANTGPGQGRAVRASAPRTFLEDGDEMVLRATAPGPSGSRILTC